MPTYTRELIAHANSEAELEGLLALHGVVVSNPDPQGRPLPRDGLGLDWMGRRTISGVALSGVFAHVWVTGLGQVSDAEWDQLLDDLHEHLWVGPALQHLLGEPGPLLPTGVTWIKWERKRRQLSGGFPATVNGQTFWFHSDSHSRTHHSGLFAAALLALIQGGNLATPINKPGTTQPATWDLMSGGTMPLTVGILLALLQGAMAHEASIHDAAKAAIEAYEAGTLTDVNSIQWPAGYGGAA